MLTEIPGALLLLAAVVAGWLVQLYLSYQQSMSFTDDVRRLRRSSPASEGTSVRVSVGQGGKRYRGGRAFVALAFDERGIVRDAISLTGFSTFARGKAFPAVLGMKAGQLAGDRAVPGASAQQREAARQAAQLLRAGGESTAPRAGEVLPTG